MPDYTAQKLMDDTRTKSDKEIALIQQAHALLGNEFEYLGSNGDFNTVTVGPLPKQSLYSTMRLLRRKVGHRLSLHAIFPRDTGPGAMVTWDAKVNDSLTISLRGEVDDYAHLLKPGAVCEVKPLATHVVCHPGGAIA